jgi:hypothetical protein
MKFRSFPAVTSFPDLYQDGPAVWQWPAPPFAWRFADHQATNRLPQPCRLETTWSSVAVEGDLLEMHPTSRSLVLRIAQGPPSTIGFERVRRITLTQPLTPAPRAAGAPVERVPAAVQEREYRLELRGGAPIVGRTAGHVQAGEGLYLYTPLDEERALQRVFVPASSYAACKFGPSAEEVAAERWIAGPAELVDALERQQQMPILRIGEALLNLGFVTQEQLNRALSRQRGDQPLGEMLVGEGVITRNDLRTALAHKMGYPLVDLTRFPVDPAVARKLPLKLATQCYAVPLFVHGDRLIVAVDRPSRVNRLHSVRAFAELKVAPVLASKSQIVLKLEELAQDDIWSQHVYSRLVFAPTTI